MRSAEGAWSMRMTPTGFKLERPWFQTKANPRWTLPCSETERKVTLVVTVSLFFRPSLPFVRWCFLVCWGSVSFGLRLVSQSAQSNRYVGWWRQVVIVFSLLHAGLKKLPDRLFFHLLCYVCGVLRHAEEMIPSLFLLNILLSLSASGKKNSDLLAGSFKDTIETNVAKARKEWCKKFITQRILTLADPASYAALSFWPLKSSASK